ncbi:hypothetical protein HA402_003925 [Bradysia odoriphaga]|nr:hypothetical protein HA402_003925 [Bradysia odoriphaga]
MENKQNKLFTLVFVFDDDKQRLLLGLKKRGFGLGKYNGFGGKVEENESIDDAALRELNEECGLSVSDSNARSPASIISISSVIQSCSRFIFSKFVSQMWTVPSLNRMK